MAINQIPFGRSCLSFRRAAPVSCQNASQTVKMAPILEKDFDGFWGKPTATIDWCESNYEVTYYVAEFCKFKLCYVQFLWSIVEMLCRKLQMFEGVATKPCT